MVVWRWSLCLCLQALLPQDPGSRPQATVHDLARVQALLQKWLDKKQRNEELRTRVVAAIARIGARAIRHLGSEAARAREGSDRDKAQALDSLICHIGLHWLEHVKKSRMFHVGQYSVLEQLQPRVGEFYLTLLIDTPQWFPEDQRIEVVAAIRDLYPKSPGKVIQERIRQIATNEDIEPLGLRTSLKYALAQWGDRSLAKDHIRKLTLEAQSKDAETSMLALKALAHAHYQIRDYLTAATIHSEFLAKAEAEDYYRAPADYYNAACCMSLSGNVVSALDLLERCLKLNNSERVDESVKLRRELFDKDPEIRAVRKTRRFRDLVSTAFPGSDAGRHGKGASTRRSREQDANKDRDKHKDR